MRSQSRGSSLFFHHRHEHSQNQALATIQNVLVKVKHLLVATQLHPQLALSHPGGALQGNSPIKTLALGKFLSDAAHLA